MGLIEYWRRSTAIDGYLRRCPKLLCERYGYEAEYTPARTLTTLRLHGLSLRYAEYACAMFAGREAFAIWALAAAAARPADHARAPHPYRAAALLAELPPPREACLARYDVLRREVAEHYNGGSYRFLPEKPLELPSWIPLRNESAIGSKAWLL